MGVENFPEFFQQFNWIDIVVLLLILRTLYVGAKRGFIPEIAMFIGLLISLIITLEHKGDVLYFISNLIPAMGSVSWLEAVVVVLLFVTTYGLFILVRSLIGRLFSLTAESIIDRWGGVLIGIARAGVMTSILFAVLIQTPFSFFETSLDRSFSGRYVIQIFPKVYEVCVQVYPFRREATSSSLS